MKIRIFGRTWDSPTRTARNLWKPAMQTHGWTTVMSWKDHGESLVYKGKKFGGKEKEFNLM